MHAVEASARRTERLRVSQQFIECNRQISYPSTGGVKHRVGDRCGRASDAELADPVGAERRVGVGDVVDQNLDVRHVEIDRDVILGQ